MYAFALDRSGVGETGWYWANKASLSGGGFAAQSTTWGASVALMGLLFLGLLHTKPTKTNPHGKPTKSANLFAAICAAGIIVTSARGALLSLVLGWTIANLKRWSFRNLVQVALMIAIATITARAIAPTDITRNLDNTATSLLETIDNMTTGRLTTVLKGIQTAAKRSVSGVGYGKSSDYDTGLVPHNTSIRLAAESGIAAGLLSLAMQISIILRTLKHRRNATETDMFPLVAGAVILAQVEPSVFFGTFNANAFLWTGIWLTTQSQQANVHQAV
jgi:O-antigen ligase